MRDGSYAESEAYDSASVLPIHTRSELSSDSDSAYDSASVTSVNQPLLSNTPNWYVQGMRDRSMRSGTELAREIQLTDWSTAGNLPSRSSGVQIPRDICTLLKRYLYSAKCGWIIIVCIMPAFCLGTATIRIIFIDYRVLVEFY